MRRPVLALTLVLAAACSLSAQFNDPAYTIRSGTTDPTSCQPRSRNVFINRASTPVLKICTAANVWSALNTSSADVVGPASATDNAAVRYDSTTGKLLQDSLLIISDTGALSGITTLQTSGNAGIGAAPSGTNGRRLLVTQNGDQNTQIAVTNSEAAGTSANAGLRVEADTAILSVLAHGSGRTLVRWGEAVDRWNEIFAVSGDGLAIGTNGSVPLKLGTATVVGLQLDGTNQHPSYPASEKCTTANFDSTSTTLAAVTGLTVNATAAKRYRFWAVLFVTADATGGHKYAVAGTATATAVVYQVNSINNATNAFRINSRQTALGGAGVGEAVGTAYFTRIDGFITVNAAGTLLVQFAQNTATGTSSVLTGSCFGVVEVQ